MFIMGDIITYPWANFDIGLAKPSMKQGQDEKFEQIVLYRCNYLCMA